MRTDIPFRDILCDTSKVSDGCGSADLSRLRQALGYWAPEVRESWFWYGQGSIIGYLDILNIYFKDNIKVRSVYKNFMDEYYKSTKL